MHNFLYAIFYNFFLHLTLSLVSATKMHVEEAATEHAARGGQGVRRLRTCVYYMNFYLTVWVFVFLFSSFFSLPLRTPSLCLCLYLNLLLISLDTSHLSFAPGEHVAGIGVQALLDAIFTVHVVRLALVFVAQNLIGCANVLEINEQKIKFFKKKSTTGKTRK